MLSKIKIIFCLLVIFLMGANFCYAADNGNGQSFADNTMDYMINIWQTSVFPFISDVWARLGGFLNKEIGNRPNIKNKLENEKKEIREVIPQLVIPFWDKIKGLIN